MKRRWEPWCTDTDTWYIVKTGEHSFKMVHESDVDFDWVAYFDRQFAEGKIKK